MSSGTDELYSLLIPMAGSRLIVPRVCVAEVSGLGQLNLLDHGPAWLVGKVGWKGRQLPLVSFEVACGDELPDIGRRTRAVIFHATSDLHGGFFAIVSQGLPQLVRINASVVSPEPGADWPEDAPILCRIRMVNEFPFVPDLDALEAMLAEAESDWR